MKHYYLLLCFYGWQFCGAQNLVPNPSFEEYDTCPDFLGQINYSVGWGSSLQTPDYYNSCCTSNTFGVPANYYGNQYAASGNAYAGFMARFPDDSWVEVLKTELTSPLSIGQRYFVSFKVSLAVGNNPSLNHNFCGVNKLGVLFSKTQFNNQNSPLPRCSYDCPQVYTDVVITDTLDWVRISGSFIADSSYNYIHLGRFNYNSITDTIQVGGTQCNAYYFVDDVCVSTDSLYAYGYSYTAITERHVDRFLIYPNPASDFVTIDFSVLDEPYSIAIYDAIGSMVFLKTVVNAIEHIPIENINTEIFFIRLIFKNEVLNYKIIKL